LGTTLTDGTINHAVYPPSPANKGVYIFNSQDDLTALTTNNFIHGGDDITDVLSPVEAVLADYFENGTYQSNIRIGMNISGSFPLGANNISNSTSTIVEVKTANTSLVKKVMQLQYTSISTLSQNYIGGKAITSASSVNFTHRFGDQVGSNFIMKLTKTGGYDWAITSEVTPHTFSSTVSIHTIQTMTEYCRKVKAFGSLYGGASFCGNSTNTGIRYGTFRWQYQNICE